MKLTLEFSTKPNGFNGARKAIPENDRETFSQHWAVETKCELEIGDVSVLEQSAVADMIRGDAIVTIQGLMRKAFGEKWPGDEGHPLWEAHCKSYNGRVWDAEGELAKGKRAAVDEDALLARLLAKRSGEVITADMVRNNDPMVGKAAKKVFR